jgi:hypothetical protein
MIFLFFADQYPKKEDKGPIEKGSALQPILSLQCNCKLAIFAHAYAFAWKECSAALTHDDVAWDGRLATKQFHTKTATSRVTTVAG